MGRTIFSAMDSDAASASDGSTTGAVGRVPCNGTTSFRHLFSQPSLFLAYPDIPGSVGKVPEKSLGSILFSLVEGSSKPLSAPAGAVESTDGRPVEAESEVGPVGTGGRRPKSLRLRSEAERGRESERAGFLRQGENPVAVVLISGEELESVKGWVGVREAVLDEESVQIGRLPVDAGLKPVAQVEGCEGEDAVAEGDVVLETEEAGIADRPVRHILRIDLGRARAARYDDHLRLRLRQSHRKIKVTYPYLPTRKLRVHLKPDTASSLLLKPTETDGTTGGSNPEDPGAEGEVDGEHESRLILDVFSRPQKPRLSCALRKEAAGLEREPVVAAPRLRLVAVLSHQLDLHRPLSSRCTPWLSKKGHEPFGSCSSGAHSS